MNEFDALITAADWSGKLNELLADAAIATAQRDDAQRLAVAARLRMFVKASPMEVSETKAFDTIAIQAAMALGDSVINDAVDRIAQRSAAIEALKTQLEDITRDHAP